MTPYIVAGVVATAILFGQYRWHDHLWFDKSATLWWIGRLVIEAAAGAGAVGLAKGVAGVADLNLSGDVDSLATGVLAGIAAPRIMSGQLPVGERNFNPLAHAYDRLRGPFDEHIDEASADAQREWVQSKVEPAARDGNLVPEQIGDAFKQTLHGRRLMGDADRVDAIQFVDEVLADSVPDEKKVAILVLRSQQLGTYRSMRKFVRDLPGR